MYRTICLFVDTCFFSFHTDFSLFRIAISKQQGIHPISYIYYYCPTTCTNTRFTDHTFCLFLYFNESAYMTSCFLNNSGSWKTRLLHPERFIKASFDSFVVSKLPVVMPQGLIVEPSQAHRFLRSQFERFVLADINRKQKKKKHDVPSIYPPHQRRPLRTITLSH